MNGYKKGRREHSQETVKNACEALNSVQKKNRKSMSTKDAILHMKKNVLAARAKGLTWEEIAGIVREAGLDIAISTLKKVVGPSKPASTPATAGKIGDRIRAERAASAPVAVAPAVPGAAPSTSQVKMDGRGGFEIRPMIDDI